jgi:hypothetical protein
LHQNGEFWENISRIEANFFIEGEGVADEAITNLELYMLGGGLIGFAWGQTNVNELEQFSEEYDGDGFDWGNVFAVTWDVDEYKRRFGSNVQPQHNPDGEYKFDNTPVNVGTEDEPNYIGGGINHFGFQLKNDAFEDLEITVNWTDVVFYVHDVDLFMEHVEMVTEETGVTMSANTEGRVRKAA